MFDRVVVMLSDQAEYKALDPAVVTMLTDYYQKALFKAMESGYEIVDKPGPDVLRVRVAITELKPSKPVANTLSTIIPVGVVVAGATKAVTDDNLGRITSYNVCYTKLLRSFSKRRLIWARPRIRPARFR